MDEEQVQQEIKKAFRIYMDIDVDNPQEVREARDAIMWAKRWKKALGRFGEALLGKVITLTVFGIAAFVLARFGEGFLDWTKGILSSGK